MHEERAIRGEAKPGDPIRIIDIGGANGFLGKLMADLAKENGLNIEYVVVDPDAEVVAQAREAYVGEPLDFMAEDCASYSRRLYGKNPEIARLNADLDKLKSRYIRSQEDLDRLQNIISQKQEMGLLDGSEAARYKALLVKDFGFDPADIPDDPEEFDYEASSLVEKFSGMIRIQMQALKDRLERILARLPAAHDLTINSWMPPDRDFTAEIRQTNGAAVVYVIETWGATGQQKHAAWPDIPKHPWEEDSYQPGEMYDQQIAWVGHSAPQLARKVYKEKDEDHHTRAFSNAFLVQTRRDLSRGFSQSNCEPESAGIRIDGSYPWEDRLEELTEGLSPTTRLKRPEERRVGYRTDYHDDLQDLINGIQNGRIRPKPTTAAEQPVRDLKAEVIEAKTKRFLEIQRWDPRRYFEIVAQLEDMASGRDPEGLRRRHYPGWTERDFQEVLDRLHAVEARTESSGEHE